MAETFVEEFSLYIHQGSRCLLPKGNLAREYIARSLTEHGAHVDEIVIYETYMPDESRTKLATMLAEKQLDILMFTSPSTVDHFMDVVKEYRLESQLEDCVDWLYWAGDREKTEIVTVYLFMLHQRVYRQRNDQKYECLS